jgi:hypothetical protein
MSTLCTQHTQRSNGKGNIMSATQFSLGLLLYIAVAVICYAAGWWQAKTVERDRAAQDQLVQRDQQGQEPGVLVGRRRVEQGAGEPVGADTAAAAHGFAISNSRSAWHG